MTSPEEPRYRTTICLHGPHEPTTQWHTDFASIDTCGANIFVRTVEEADAFIAAARAAKDLIIAATACGDIARHAKLSCELAPGHEGWHRAGQTVWPWLCDATTPARHHDGKFQCTLDAGHDGDHEAGGTGKPPLTWPQEPAPECSACGATTELAAVHDTGGDGSVLYYCGDMEGCQARRIARRAAVTS